MRAATATLSSAQGTALRKAASAAVANLAPRRLLSIPYLLAGIWLLVLLWGERWVFGAHVQRCGWERWEAWPAGSIPHHLVLLADPQLIDAFSYPGRPWLLAHLTRAMTDRYMRRSFVQLEQQLRPDSIFFLGDLFDGGREWRTEQDDLTEPAWAPMRPAQEQPYVQRWRAENGQSYWLDELKRFRTIFTNHWNGGSLPDNATGSRQRGRKLVASLPGNHDIGFGSLVRLSVRDRFRTHFGDGNRIDVIGNHTVVSVDSVSLSASAAAVASTVDLRPIHHPTELFLQGVREAKLRAVQRELCFWYGSGPHRHLVHNCDQDSSPSELIHQRSDLDSSKVALPSDFPTIVLTHVPLYRPRGTPCGPMREKRPPTPPPAGQLGPVLFDEANAIPVNSGYQYQCILSMEHSHMILDQAGNVTHVFSADDHDYCDVVHKRENKRSVREITVKTISMAMGVSYPAFMMVSLFNPVAPDGTPLRPATSTEPTLQTHLCLLPSTKAIYIRYGVLAIFSLAALLIRARLIASSPSRGRAGGRPSTDATDLSLPRFLDHGTSSGSSASHSLLLPPSDGTPLKRAIKSPRGWAGVSRPLFQVRHHGVSVGWRGRSLLSSPTAASAGWLLLGRCPPRTLVRKFLLSSLGVGLTFLLAFAYLTYQASVCRGLTRVGSC